MNKQKYIPAARIESITWIYDPFIKILFGKTFKKIADYLPIQDNLQLLDIACGPGNLLLEINKKSPKAKITGLDIDPKILKIAAQKTKDIQNIKLVKASATELPFKDNSFDLVTSTLAFHHLDLKQKQKAFSEIKRILKPGGSFWLYDFSKPSSITGKILASFYKHLEEIEDNVNGKLLSLFKENHFQNINTHFSNYGLISLISGHKK